MNSNEVLEILNKHLGHLPSTISDANHINGFCQEMTARTTDELNKVNSATYAAKVKLEAMQNVFTMLGLSVECIDECIDWGCGEWHQDIRAFIYCRDKKMEVLDPDYDKFDIDAFCEFRNMVNEVGEIS